MVFQSNIYPEKGVISISQGGRTNDPIPVTGLVRRGLNPRAQITVKGENPRGCWRLCGHLVNQNTKLIIPVKGNMNLQTQLYMHSGES